MKKSFLFVILISVICTASEQVSLNYTAWNNALDSKCGVSHVIQLHAMDNKHRDIRIMVHGKPICSLNSKLDSLIDTHEEVCRLQSSYDQVEEQVVVLRHSNESISSKRNALLEKQAALAESQNDMIEELTQIDQKLSKIQQGYLEFCQKQSELCKTYKTILIKFSKIHTPSEEDIVRKNSIEKLYKDSLQKLMQMKEKYKDKYGSYPILQ